MKKHGRALSVLLILILALMPLAGCGGEQDETGELPGSEGQQAAEEADPLSFSASDGIDDKGYWTGITALDHVELFDFAAMTIPAEVHLISEEAVQQQVDGILDNFSGTEQVRDRAIADGDTVNIDYVGSVDGVAFDGGSTGGMGTDVTIGVTSYIDDFLEQLIGHTPGETVHVEVTFPENYGVENLNGRDALFVTEINYIVGGTVLPQLDDDFVLENFGETQGWSTVAEMNQGISDDLQRAAVQNHIKEYLMENAAISSLPDALVAYMEDSMVSYYQDMAGYYGADMSELLAMYGLETVEELIEQNRQDNEDQARYSLVMQAVAEQAGITAGDEDVAAYFTEVFGTGDYAQYEAQYGMPYLKQVALQQMVLDHLAAQAVLE